MYSNWGYAWANGFVVLADGLDMSRPGAVVSRHCGVVVSVLATGPKGRGFKLCRGDEFLRTIKISSSPSFGWKVKPEVPCRKILRHLKIPWGISDIDRQNSHSLRPFLILTPDVSAGRTARELWWTSQELSPVGIITTMALNVHISPGGWTIDPLVAAVLRQSHPIIISQGAVVTCYQDHHKYSFRRKRRITESYSCWKR
jgi:hypothetical protein